MGCLALYPGYFFFFHAGRGGEGGGLSCSALAAWLLLFLMFKLLLS